MYSGCGSTSQEKVRYSPQRWLDLSGYTMHVYPRQDLQAPVDDVHRSKTNSSQLLVISGI